MDHYSSHGLFQTKIEPLPGQTSVSCFLTVTLAWLYLSLNWLNFTKNNLELQVAILGGVSAMKRLFVWDVSALYQIRVWLLKGTAVDVSNVWPSCQWYNLGKTRIGTKHWGTPPMKLRVYIFRVDWGFLMLKSYAVMVEKGGLQSVFLTREIPAYFSSSRTTHYTDIVVKERRKLYL